MPTTTFNHANLIVAIAGPSDPVFPIPNAFGPYMMTWDDTLEPGDEFTLTGTGAGGAPVSVQVTYTGVSAAGEPAFSATIAGNDVPFFLSSEQYSPFQTAPTFEEVAFCFLAGTRIATPQGEVAVEDLSIGDLVLTGDGRAVPVKWLGRQTIYAGFGLSIRSHPMLVSAGALGENLPVRDLRLTWDHALLIDGVLVHAGALVNGTTIRPVPREELGERFVVYHVETEDHEIILAEGAPSETFIDNVSRRHFDNYAEFEALFGAAPAAMQELPQPRAMSRRQVPPAIHARIAAAAMTLPPLSQEEAA
jgi:Hint domain